MKWVIDYNRKDAVNANAIQRHEEGLNILTAENKEFRERLAKVEVQTALNDKDSQESSTSE